MNVASSTADTAPTLRVGRVEVREDASELVMVVPVLRSWRRFTLAILPLLILVALWPARHSGSYLAAALDFLWTNGVVAAIIAGPALYQPAGTQTLRVSANRLTLRWQVLGLGWNSRFDVAKVTSLRWVPSPRNPKSGRAAFDADFLTHYWGEGLSKEEVDQLNSILRPRIESANQLPDSRPAGIFLPS